MTVKNIIVYERRSFIIPCSTSVFFLLERFFLSRKVSTLGRSVYLLEARRFKWLVTES